MKRLAALGVMAVLLAGCGGSGGSLTPTIQSARNYKLIGFTPSGPVKPGKPVTVSFKIQLPDGSFLSKFKTGPGPHTGVHMIYVRKDLSTIIHHHPPLHGSATIVDDATFPMPGPYKLVIDVYPKTCPSGTSPIPGSSLQVCNFQLFTTIHVSGTYKPQPLPAPVTSETVDGYHFTLTGAGHLAAIQAQLVQVHVTDPQGRPAIFTPWYGALAHAIFFRRGSLDYFHTHICAKNAIGCTSILAGKTVTGTSTTPGKLNVGVLVPAPGTWRLFVQCQVDGHILTAPFTLHVS
ncbi:MAG TPA: hypothetical protein VGL76_11030 [Gaiellaceae bacterium]|jgi:hypothetical protein